jgi:hypothetical protein
MLLFERSSVLTYSTGHLNTRVAVPCIIICTSAAGREDAAYLRMMSMSQGA